MLKHLGAIMESRDRIVAVLVGLLFLLVVGGMSWLTQPTATVHAPSARTAIAP